ncbi:MAG TPA: heparan-alpha-glucosaminide N-acetyltransferase [Methylophilaceae bacterium]|nr:heparan-alpha-glucosaminide N-acetyltransferase [Methylophilaceae bacterium]
MAKPANPRKKIKQVTKPEQSAPVRYPLIDAWRGLAIVLMIVFHFCFDLNLYQFITQDFYHSHFWLGARDFIVTMFLLIVGISLVLAQKSSTHSKRKRLLTLAGCAALVTLGSMVMFPQSYIFFGILHFILVASLIGQFMLRFYWLNLVLGIAILLTGMLYANALFDQPCLQWLGLMTHKPVTEDYVPLFPWLGVVLAGIFLGKYLLAHRLMRLTWLGNNRFSKPLGGLGWLGRRSLLIYMIHQPILLAGLSAWSWLSLN